MRPVWITGLGVVSALGDDPGAVGAALARGEVALRPAGDHRDRLPFPGFGLADVDVRPLLKRKKDRKLLPRAAELAIPAAHAALGGLDPAEVGLVMGVGREPADEEAETELALIAAMRDGELDVARLQGPARALYPPLASLRTLPNLVLAHVSIHLGCAGAGATRAGGAAAGLAALVEAWWEIAEGRSEQVLAGAADSLVGATLARDALRLGRTAPPGEAAAFLLLESADAARARGARPLACIEGGGCAPHPSPPAWREPSEALGDCGAAAAVLDVVVSVALGRGGLRAASEASDAGAWIAWSPC